MLSLRIRIFLSMIVLILIASILMASISIIQFKNEAKDYHQERLERKEIAIKEHIQYVLSTTTYPLTTKNLGLIFKDKIHEFAQIHGLEINIYSLDGKLLKSSKASFLSTAFRHQFRNTSSNSYNRRSKNATSTSRTSTACATVRRTAKSKMRSSNRLGSSICLMLKTTDFMKKSFKISSSAWAKFMRLCL